MKTSDHAATAASARPTRISRQTLRGFVFALAVSVAILVFIAVTLSVSLLYENILSRQAHATSESISQQTFNGMFQLMRQGWTREQLEAYLSGTREAFAGTPFEVELFRGERVSELYGTIDDPPRDAIVARAFESGEKQIREDRREVRHVHPMLARNECLICHANAAPGDVLGVIDVRQQLEPVTGELRQRHLVLLAAFGITILLMAAAASLLAIRRINQAVDCFRGEVAEVNSLDDLGRMAIHEVNFGFGELDQAFSEVGHLVDRVRGIAVDKALLQDKVEELQRAHNELKLAATVFDNSVDAITITDADNRILRVNDAFEEITGYRADEVVGENPHLLSSGMQGPDFYEQMWRAIVHDGFWQGEIWNRRKNGEIYPEWLTISTVKDSSGAITHHIAIFSDITERKASEERIRHLAQHDLLTDLPNRVLLNDRLEQTIALARRNRTAFALMFLDLDKFKQINDTLGHHVGDLLLQEVANRLRSCLRESDTVSRQGGDEFIILLPQSESRDQAERVAEKVRSSIVAPYDLEGHRLEISVSIGVALYPEHGETIEVLMQAADGAMYAAKQAGRDNYRFADEADPA